MAARSYAGFPDADQPGPRAAATGHAARIASGDLVPWVPGPCVSVFVELPRRVEEDEDAGLPMDDADLDWRLSLWDGSRRRISADARAAVIPTASEGTSGPRVRVVRFDLPVDRTWPPSAPLTLSLQAVLGDHVLASGSCRISLCDAPAPAGRAGDATSAPFGRVVPVRVALARSHGNPPTHRLVAGARAAPDPPAARPGTEALSACLGVAPVRWAAFSTWGGAAPVPASCLTAGDLLAPGRNDVFLNCRRLLAIPTRFLSGTGGPAGDAADSGADSGALVGKAMPLCLGSTTMLVALCRGDGSLASPLRVMGSASVSRSGSWKAALAREVAVSIPAASEGLASQPAAGSRGATAAGDVSPGALGGDASLFVLFILATPPPDAVDDPSAASSTPGTAGAALPVAAAFAFLPLTRPGGSALPNASMALRLYPGSPPRLPAGPSGGPALRSAGPCPIDVTVDVVPVAAFGSRSAGPSRDGGSDADLPEGLRGLGVHCLAAAPAPALLASSRHRSPRSPPGSTLADAVAAAQAIGAFPSVLLVRPELVSSRVVSDAPLAALLRAAASGPPGADRGGWAAPVASPAAESTGTGYAHGVHSGSAAAALLGALSEASSSPAGDGAAIAIAVRAAARAQAQLGGAAVPRREAAGLGPDGATLATALDGAAPTGLFKARRHLLRLLARLLARSLASAGADPSKPLTRPDALPIHRPPSASLAGSPSAADGFHDADSAAATAGFAAADDPRGDAEAAWRARLVLELLLRATSVLTSSEELCTPECAAAADECIWAMDSDAGSGAIPGSAHQPAAAGPEGCLPPSMSGTVTRLARAKAIAALRQVATAPAGTFAGLATARPHGAAGAADSASTGPDGALGARPLPSHHVGGAAQLAGRAEPADGPFRRRGTASRRAGGADADAEAEAAADADAADADTDADARKRRSAASAGQLAPLLLDEMVAALRGWGLLAASACRRAAASGGLHGEQAGPDALVWRAAEDARLAVMAEGDAEAEEEARAAEAAADGVDDARSRGLRAGWARRTGGAGRAGVGAGARGSGSSGGEDDDGDEAAAAAERRWRRSAAVAERAAAAAAGAADEAVRAAVAGALAAELPAPRPESEAAEEAAACHVIGVLVACEAAGKAIPRGALPAALGARAALARLVSTVSAVAGALLPAEVVARLSRAALAACLGPIVAAATRPGDSAAAPPSSESSAAAVAWRGPSSSSLQTAAAPGPAEDGRERWHEGDSPGRRRRAGGRRAAPSPFPDAPAPLSARVRPRQRSPDPWRVSGGARGAAAAVSSAASAGPDDADAGSVASGVSASSVTARYRALLSTASRRALPGPPPSVRASRARADAEASRQLAPALPRPDDWAPPRSSSARPPTAPAPAPAPAWQRTSRDRSHGPHASLASAKPAAGRAMTPGRSRTASSVSAAPLEPCIGARTCWQAAGIDMPADSHAAAAATHGAAAAALAAAVAVSRGVSPHGSLPPAVDAVVPCLAVAEALAEAATALAHLFGAASLEVAGPRCDATGLLDEAASEAADPRAAARVGSMRAAALAQAVLLPDAVAVFAAASDAAAMCAAVGSACCACASLALPACSADGRSRLRSRRRRARALPPCGRRASTWRWPCRPTWPPLPPRL